MRHKQHLRLIVASIGICVFLLATTFALWTRQYTLQGQISMERQVEGTVIEEDDTLCCP